MIRKKDGKQGKENEEQMTQGHNIVADGWAGESNTHPYPNPHPPSHINIHNKSSKDRMWSAEPVALLYCCFKAVEWEQGSDPKEPMSCRKQGWTVMSVHPWLIWWGWQILGLRRLVWDSSHLGKIWVIRLRIKLRHSIYALRNFVL